MSETSIVAIFLAMITGITVVAYRDSKGFEGLSLLLMKVLFAAGVAFSSWQVLNIVSAENIIRHLIMEVPTHPLSAAAQYADDMHKAMTRLGWCVVACVAMAVYLGFLKTLPILLKPPKA